MSRGIFHKISETVESMRNANERSEFPKKKDKLIWNIEPLTSLRKLLCKGIFLSQSPRKGNMRNVRETH